jgi:glycosyltransferase involved in cell wall biosynthesis
LNSDGPLVSAIVPAYNAARYIGHTLRSLVNQTYPNMEIIVVDDGSSDATVPLISELTRHYPQIRLVQQRNSGVASARNHGVSMSRGEFIAPVDADDVWFPQAAERLTTCLLTSRCSVGVAYGWSVTIDQEGLLDGGFRCSMIGGDVLNTLSAHNFIGNASSTMIRRGCFEQVGGYDRRFREQGAQGCEDWDLYLRIAERCQFRVVPEFIVGYRRAEFSMSSDASAMAKSHAYLLRQLQQRHPGFPRVLKQLSKSSLYLYLAQECHRRRLPYESYHWLRQALVEGHIYTLLRPSCYALVVKNAFAILSKTPSRSMRSTNDVTSHNTALTLHNEHEAAIADVVRRRARIKMKILTQDILHNALSRLPIS